MNCRAGYLVILLAICCEGVFADTVQRIYTAPDPTSQGGITGSVSLPVTHAIAIEHGHTKVYRAGMTDGGKTFLFEHLPIGKYDIVLVTASGAVFEGLALGNEHPTLSAASSANLIKRVAAQDAFFNRYVTHRLGYEGENAFAFVERIRDNPTLTQAGELMKVSLRRLELMELASAQDDWQLTTTRHIYREEAPLGRIPFFAHKYLPELGNIRVIDAVKKLGTIPLLIN